MAFVTSIYLFSNFSAIISMIQRDVGFDSTAEELSFECEQEGIYFICESPIPIEEMDITKSFDVTLKTSHQLEAAETVDIAGIPAQEINKIKLDRTKILEFEIPLISYGSMEIKIGDKTKTINYSSYLAPDTTDSEKEAGDRLGLIKTETGWTQDYKIFSDHALYSNNEIIFSADVDAPQNIDVSLEFPADSTVQLGTFYRWDNGIWIESDYILYADSLTYFKQEFDWFERNKPQVKFNISVIGDNGYVGLMDPLISACGALSTVNAVYTLTSSVSSAGTCFTVTNDNITLDCDGYNITYAQTLEGYAFYNTGGYDSVKIKNCNIDQPGTGPANSHAIYYWTGNNGEILNNNIDVRQSNCDGIYIRSSDSNLISENNIITRWGDGINIFSSLWTDIENNVINTLDADTIYLLSSARSNIINNNIISIGFGNAIYLGSSNINTIINNNVTVTGVLNRAIYVESSTSNIIYNNLFNSSTPFTFGGSILINNWNTTKQAGTRIYSDGTQIGGNYWTNPTKTGYSDTCIDSDVDDFCDVGYDLSGDGKNIDYLPLTATDVQYISACAVLDQEGTTYIMTSDIINSGANVCINISANDVTLDCQGYMIDGNVLTGDVGIGVLRTSSTDTDVTIRNCVVEDWLDYGIYLRYA
ncbi:MAG: right-handed parallel beta-helix repeat-containing protein, partial [Candidatus Aenigmarchaeota archaeon]|nr:right-handed parallel beta-helix repeat-containing protein [Candidatus Aenigmarchaeota archaeon]